MIIDFDLSKKSYTVIPRYFTKDHFLFLKQKIKYISKNV